MSTTETIRAWATTNAGNASADAAITSSDSMSPASLDNVDRSIMVAVRKQMDDIGGKLAAGGTANALTVTTGQVLESGQITDGLRILLKATADNTNATVTFAPDGLTAANIKRADGSALAVGSIKSGMYLDLVYNSGSSEWRCANIAPGGAGPSSPGIVLLASGTIAAATLDLVLTTYTAYRGIRVLLSGFRPSVDGDVLYLQLSTNGGVSYDISGYSYALHYLHDTVGTGGVSAETSGSVGGIPLGPTGAGIGVGSAATAGWNGEVTLLNQTSTAFWPRAHHQGYFKNSAGNGMSVSGGGMREAAQDTDAMRFTFASGNIAAGNYAVYGLA